MRWRDTLNRPASRSSSSPRTMTPPAPAPHLDAYLPTIQIRSPRVTRDSRRQCHHNRDRPPQEGRTMPQDELRDGKHRRVVVPLGAPRAYRQERKQRRQEGDRKHKRGDDAKRDERSQVTVRRHLGEIHGQQPDCRGQARQKHRVQVDPDRFDDRRTLGIPRTRKPRWPRCRSSARQHPLPPRCRPQACPRHQRPCAQKWRRPRRRSSETSGASFRSWSPRRQSRQWR